MEYVKYCDRNDIIDHLNYVITTQLCTFSISPSLKAEAEYCNSPALGPGIVDQYSAVECNGR